MGPLTRLSLVCVSVLVVGCSFDESGVMLTASDGGVDNPSTPDAAVVGCTSNLDCASPPGLCLTAGTCGQNGMCQFPSVDCSAMDGTCAAGTCEPTTGACIQEPANEGNVCQPATMGDWSDCMADATCGSAGQRQRMVTARTCTSGACTADAPTQETGNCTIPPEDVIGSPCGAQSCDSWSDCETPPWGDQCSSNGEKTRECSGSTCNVLGMCEPDTYDESDSCVLDTNGDECFGCWGGPPGSDCECDGGSCVPETN